MCEHIEFAQRLLLAQSFIQAHPGQKLTWDNIRDHWFKETGIKETDSYVSGVVSALARSGLGFLMRGKWVVYETEEMRSERLATERAKDRAEVLKVVQRAIEMANAFKATYGSPEDLAAGIKAI